MTPDEAPPPGWYPDPEGGIRLRWWLGTDWSDRYRPPPSPGELQRAAAARAAAAPTAVPVTGSEERRRLSRTDVDQIVAEVRQTARSEIDRASQQLTQRAQAAARDFQPLVSEYTNRIVRWLRILLVVIVVAVVAWVVFEAVAQATFLDWLGDRIDALTD